MRHLAHEASDVGHCNARIDFVDPRLPGVPRGARLLIDSRQQAEVHTGRKGCSCYDLRSPRCSSPPCSRDVRSTATNTVCGRSRTPPTRTSIATWRLAAPASRVGSVEGNPDPNTYFLPPITEDQTKANRLFQRCMSARGWWNQQPRL